MQVARRRCETMQYLQRNYQIGICALALCLFLGACPARGQSAAPDPQVQPQPQCPEPGDLAGANSDPAAGFCYYGNLRLRNTSLKIANDVCLPYDPGTPEHQGPGRKHCLPALLKKLGKMSEDDRCMAQATTALILREEITERILTASLQVDGFLAEIDSETNRIRAVKDSLTDQQTSAMNRSSLGVNVGTGGGAVGSALALGARTAVTIGGWIGAVSGISGAAFGFYNYFATARSPKGCFPDNPKSKNASCKPLVCPNHGIADRTCSPAMLVDLFPETRPGTALFHSDYDPVIENYLQREKEQLIKDWTPALGGSLGNNLLGKRLLRGGLLDGRLLGGSFLGRRLFDCCLLCRNFLRGLYDRLPNCIFNSFLADSLEQGFPDGNFNPFDSFVMLAFFVSHGEVPQ